MAKEIKITLVAARVNAGYTQAQAAESLGISVETIKNIEQGRTDPRVSTVLQLADLYHIPIDNLILPQKSA